LVDWPDPAYLPGGQECGGLIGSMRMIGFVQLLCGNVIFD
jgi:hypothetical protein